MLHPDDNAIYGYDLYEDDANKQKGGTGGGEANGKTDASTGTNANEMQYDDAGFYGETDKEKNEVQLFDDGQQGKEGTDVREEETSVTETDTGVAENKEEMGSSQPTAEEADAIPPTETEADMGRSEPEPKPNTDEGDVIAPTETEEDIGRSEPEPKPNTEEGDVLAPTETEEDMGRSEPEPEANTEEADVIPPPPNDDVAVDTMGS